MDAKTHADALRSAIGKVRAAAELAISDVGDNPQTVVSFDTDEVMALANAHPDMWPAFIARPVPQWTDVLDTGSDGSEPPEAQARDAARIAATLAGYGLPPVYIGQGK